jgi:sulfide:quinone oxidoreductase
MHRGPGGETLANVEETGAFRVLIAGGGFAALEAMVALRALAEERVTVELLAPDSDFAYRPLAVASPFGLSQVHRFPLSILAERSGASYRAAALAAVDSRAYRAWTSEDEWLSYDALLVACGATATEAVPGSLTFRGPRDVQRFQNLLEQLELGKVKRLAFAVAAGISWPLPLYELAILTARRMREAEAYAEITFVTPERGPLAVFGAGASGVVRELLEEQGVRLVTEAHPVCLAGGGLQLLGGEVIPVDAVVSLPLLRGPYLSGLPHDALGFLRVDDHGRVEGVRGVYAAGDATAFPVKQGGLATQQADVVAEAIAAEAGAPVEPKPLDPVLQALLITGERPAHLRAALGGHHGDPGVADWEPLWWPPAKVAGRYLAPFLAEHIGLATGSRS